MNITPDVWQALRRAVERDDEDTFETIVLALVRQTLRDERADQAARRPIGQPYLLNQR
jgi:hypothetical protein